MAILGEELPSSQRHGLPCLFVSGSQINLPPPTWNYYHKMVLSGLPYENNFVCMLVPSHSRELAFWVIGANSWIKYNKLTRQPFRDAVFCNGSFYLLDDGFKIWQIDVRSIYSAINNDDDAFGALSNIETRIHEVKWPGIFQLQYEWMRKILRDQDANEIFTYLVESLGKLLLVLRYFNLKQNTLIETKKFEVYALDFGELSWKNVEDLGDEMIFLGKCCSTSFYVKELGVGFRNSIYFCNDPITPW